MRGYIFFALILIPCVVIIAGNSLFSSDEIQGRRVARMEKTETKKSEIREPAVAGSFYTSDPRALSKQIKGFLDAVPERKIEGEIIALISPHAGYIYSGQVAAYAYKLLIENSFDKVIVIAPSHHMYFHGASIYSKGAFRTPLGLIPIEEEISQKIIKESPTVSFLPQAHTQEHSLEIQLPFLQTVLKDFQLIPIIMGDQNLENCKTLSDALFTVIKGKKILIVASSDLSHFYSYDEAVRLDTVVADRIKNFDPRGLSRDLSEGRCEACGGGPIITTMLLAQKMGANRALVLKYANSGDVTGDKSRVVGYLAAVLSRDSKSLPGKGVNKKVGIDLGLNDEEKRFLHQVAKVSIEAKLRGESPPHFEPPSSQLNEKRGAFVSLHRHGQLRGCIGYIQAYKPLYQTVSEMATAAAFQDSRFTALRKEESKDLKIEISVLTPLKRITDIKEIEIGKHGIYIVKGFNSGLLLPQVATQYGWDAKTFLEHTCQKAGLSQDAWKEKDSEIYIFSADIF
jgi:hypothetical protein